MKQLGGETLTNSQHDIKEPMTESTLESLAKKLKKHNTQVIKGSMSYNEAVTNILREAVNRWGEDSQILQAIQELSELIKALCKTYQGGTWKRVYEEIADVEIMIDQLKLMEFFDKTDVETVKTKKLARLKHKLDWDEWIDWNMSEKTAIAIVMG